MRKKNGQKIDLRANPQCPDCAGKGWNLILRPDLVSKYKEIRPCHCVRALVEHRPDAERVCEQYVILR